MTKRVRSRRRPVLTGLTDAFGTAGEEIRKVVCEIFVCGVRGGRYDGRNDRSCGEFSVVIWSQRGISAPDVASGYVKGLLQTNDVHK